MDTQNNESGFRFSDPKLVFSIFIVNKSYNGDFSKIKDIPFKIETQASQTTELKDGIHQQATVMLILKTSDEIEMDETIPCYISASIEAGFAWKKKEYDENTLNILLKENAPALLLSYLRQHIVTLTEASEIPVQHIPFIDFTNNVNDDDN